MCHKHRHTGAPQNPDNMIPENPAYFSNSHEMLHKYISPANFSPFCPSTTIHLTPNNEVEIFRTTVSATLGLSPTVGSMHSHPSRPSLKFTQQRGPADRDYHTASSITLPPFGIFLATTHNIFTQHIRFDVDIARNKMRPIKGTITSPEPTESNCPSSATTTQHQFPHLSPITRDLANKRLAYNHPSREARPLTQSASPYII